MCAVYWLNELPFEQFLQRLLRLIKRQIVDDFSAYNPAYWSIFSASIGWSEALDLSQLSYYIPAGTLSDWDEIAPWKIGKGRKWRNKEKSGKTYDMFSFVVFVPAAYTVKKLQEIAPPRCFVTHPT